jgi:tRNA threonylcarbamoyladenosine modification (KEOPS) complex  Pcc1 subunit
MTPGEAPWTATLTVRTRTDRLATMLERSLHPEVDREVPRARAALDRPSPDTLEITIWARDSGAMRAAVNTYLGWVSLAVATVGAVSGPPASVEPAPT